MPVAAPSEDFLTRKWGPMPVWAWGGLGLGGAYAVARWRASKNAQSQQGTGAAAQPASGGPEYVIENNLPWATAPSSPVNVTVTGSPPVIGQPATGPHPPIPPTGPGGPINQGGTAGNPGTPGRTPPPPPRSAGPSSPTPHMVVAGDTLTKIAEESGYGADWQAIWNYNIGPSSPQSAQAKAVLVRQTPNRIYPGQTIYIPPK